MRQPAFLIVLAASSSLIALLANIYYLGVADDPRMVKQSALALILVTGVFSAAIYSSVSVSDEISNGTALVTLAKPISRLSFLLGKFAGLAIALLLQVFVQVLVALLASRMDFDTYGSPDRVAAFGLFGAILLAFGLAGLSNFFARRLFISDAVIGLGSLIAIAFIAINFIDREGQVQPFGAGIDWRILPAAALIYAALLGLAAIALACSTRLEMAPSLAICACLFMLGLVSDYFFGQSSSDGSISAIALRTIIPNWQLFWIADALYGERTVPWSYVTNAFGYAVAYLVFALSLAMAMFEDRELS